MARWQAWKNRFCTALFLGVVTSQAALADPVLSITAAPDPAVQGSPVALDILITGIADLYAYQFTLSFDPAILQATSVTEGSFLTTGGSTFFDGGTVDNSLGSISFAFDTLIGPIAGVSGSGVLAHMTFDVTSVGTSALTFSDALFLDSAFGDLAVQAQNGSLMAVAVPEPASYALFALGLVGVALARRRQAN